MKIIIFMFKIQFRIKKYGLQWDNIKYIYGQFINQRLNNHGYEIRCMLENYFLLEFVNKKKNKL